MLLNYFVIVAVKKKKLGSGKEINFENLLRSDMEKRVKNVTFT